MISEELQKKIDSSIKLLRAVQKSRPNEIIEVAYSGGKDSDVILQLAKEAGINYEAIYKNTTIDPPGTIKHAQEMGAEIHQPKKTFFQLIEENGLPSRFSRHCCKFLKEYKILDKVVIGIRREESTKRADIYKEPTECRFYGSKKEHVEAIYPILEWETKDVADFLQDRRIKCAPVYYDENGMFHAERRLGCMCCPLASKKKRIEQFRKYPGMVKQYVRRCRKYRETHPQSKVVSVYFQDEYEQVFRDIFCDTNLDLDKYRIGVFGRLDFKKFLEEYVDVKL